MQPGKEGDQRKSNWEDFLRRNPQLLAYVSVLLLLLAGCVEARTTGDQPLQEGVQGIPVCEVDGDVNFAELLAGTPEEVAQVWDYIFCSGITEQMAESFQMPVEYMGHLDSNESKKFDLTAGQLHVFTIGLEGTIPGRAETSIVSNTGLQVLQGNAMATVLSPIEVGASMDLEVEHYPPVGQKLSVGWQRLGDNSVGVLVVNPFTDSQIGFGTYDENTDPGTPSEDQQVVNFFQLFRTAGLPGRVSYL